VATILLAAAAPAPQASTFSGAYYHPQTHELVLMTIYRGTNPDHQFSVRWGECQPLGGDGTTHQIVRQVLDSQWDDAAQQTFTKTVRFNVASLNCRPATVTLRTAPRFEYTLQIP
jgi:hypothetical protein